jgi:hypothetical protein
MFLHLEKSDYGILLQHDIFMEIVSARIKKIHFIGKSVS